MREFAYILLALIVAGAVAACGGGTGELAFSFPADAVLELKAVDATGLELPATASQLVSTTDGFSVYTKSSEAVGFTVLLDAEQWHVSQVEQGEYFGADDLFLAVTEYPGLVALGGYHRTAAVVPQDGALVARVFMVPSTSARVVSTLPTGENAKARDFSYVDNGDGSVSFEWRYHNVGDYNQDGEVNISDITPVGLHFSAVSGGLGWSEASLADGDGNGEVNIGDLTPIGQYFLTQVSGYYLEESSSADGPWSEAASVLLSDGVPSPWLQYSVQVSTPMDGGWYRVRGYHDSDSSQGVATAALQVNVLPPGDNPIAIASADIATGVVPFDVSFSATGSYDPDGSIEQYLWDLDGDGAYETDATTTQGAVDHTYSVSGTYYVRLKVLDNDGRNGVDTVTINASGTPAEQPPEAHAYCVPNEGWAPLMVYFSTFGSNDNGAITKIEWDLDGNGSFEADASANDGYISSLYSEPGEHSITVRLTDDEDNTSTASVTVSVHDPGTSSVDYWSVFDDSQVRRVEISVSQANWELMWQDVQAEVEVEADALVFPDTPFATQLDSVGFRMKGNSSLNNPSLKKPWKIDTNEYVETQDFQNLKMLIFNNGFKDPSLTRETLGYDMFYHAGVPCSHTCFVEVWISIGGAPLEFWGVYTMVERVDKKLVENRFGNDGGNLYKAKHGADLTYRGEDISMYPPGDGDSCYQKETNEDEADWSDVINLCRVIDGTHYNSPEDFATALEAVFNVDGFLRYLAATLAHSNLDIYMYMSQNYYLYLNEDTGKFEWIPWDLNEAWGQFGGQEANENHPLYALRSDVGGGGTPQAPLFYKVMEVEEYRQALAAYYDLLRRTFFFEANIATQAEGWHDLIHDSVYQDGVNGDKMYYGPNSLYDPEDFDANWQYDVLPSGPPPQGFAAYGVVSFTTTRCSYIDAHLLADL